MKLRNYEKLRNLKMKVSKQIFKCTHCEADKKLRIYCHHQFSKKSNCEQKKLKEVLLWLEETEKMILKIKCVNFLRETAYTHHFPTSDTGMGAGAVSVLLGGKNDSGWGEC